MDGFLGTRASFSYDAAYLLLSATIVGYVLSLDLLLVRKNYVAHRRLQLLLTVLFAAATVLFTAEFTRSDWRLLAVESPALGDPGQGIAPITRMTLTIHLVFWGVTAAIWSVLLVQALRHMPDPNRPGPFGRHYLFWIVLLALQAFLTTLIGWEFYLLAFCF